MNKPVSRKKALPRAGFGVLVLTSAAGAACGMQLFARERLGSLLLQPGEILENAVTDQSFRRGDDCCAPQNPSSEEINRAR